MQRETGVASGESTTGLSRGAGRRRLRVTLLIRSLERGGAERQLVLLARLLHGAGHEVAVITFHPGGALEDELRSAGITPRCAGRRSRYDVAGFVLRVRREIARTHPDVVYSSLAGANVLAALLARGAGARKVVWRLAASNVDLAHYDRWTRLAYGVERRLARCADVVVANSQAGAARARAAGFAPAKLVVIPNGIDTDRFRPDARARESLRERWRIGAGEIAVGLVARLDPIKDHETFLEAAALEAGLAGPARAAVRFVCVGEGEPRRRASLAGLAERLGLGDALLWVDGRDDMGEVYNAFDVLCLSSRGEGFPNVVGEGMACGLPCVSTDVGDVREIVGETGVVVPVGSPLALARGIRTVVERTAADRAVLGRQARERIVSCYGLDALLERALAVLDGPRAGATQG